MTEQRRAIVTGAASGIGRATAERLLADGWQVVGIDLNDRMPEGAVAVAGDAARDDVLKEALAKVGGLLHGLVCAAGLPPNETWDDPAAWDALIDLDLAAPYRAVRAAMPALTAAQGSVVF